MFGDVDGMSMGGREARRGSWGPGRFLIPVVVTDSVRLGRSPRSCLGLEPHRVFGACAGARYMFHLSAPCGSIPLRWRTGAISRDEHILAHVINIGRFWTFSVYYVVSELWGSVSWLGRLRVAGVCACLEIQA